jgi:hypothetical protein
MNAEKRLLRAIAKVLHAHGEVRGEGMLVVDPDAVGAALAALGVLRAPREPGDDDQDGDRGEDGETGQQAYDPVKEGWEMAARQKRAAARLRDGFR